MNRPQSIPANYIETEPGVWVHPSRLPHTALKDAIGACEIHKQAANLRVELKHGKPPTTHFVDTKGIKTPKQPKPRLNRLETRYRDYLLTGGVKVMEQAITLRLNPPFRSYTADLAYTAEYGGLVLVEVKGPHRFREKGIAKAALAAKTYPHFRFELADWTGKEWKESVLSP